MIANRVKVHVIPIIIGPRPGSSGLGFGIVVLLAMASGQVQLLTSEY